MASFADSVAPIGAAFKQTSTRGSAPRVPPISPKGPGVICLVILVGGRPPPARQGLGPELLLEFRPVEQAVAVLVGPHQSRQAPILKLVIIRKGERRYSPGRR